MAKKEQKINFKRNFKNYLKIIKPYRVSYFLIILAVLIAAMTKIVDKYLFKLLIDNSTLFSNNELLKSSFIQILIAIAIAYISLILIGSLMDWIKVHLLNRMATKMRADLKVRYFFHILRLDYDFHTSHKTGSLISKLNRGSWSLDHLTNLIIFNFSPIILQVGAALLAVIYFDLISAIVVIIMSIVFITYSWVILNKSKTSRILALNAEDLEKALIGDSFTNIDSIKYYGKENRVNNKYVELVDDTKKKFLRNWDYFRWMDSGQTLIIGLGLFFLMVFPTLRFLNGEITLGTLAFMYTISGTIINPLFGFTWGIRGFYDSMADLQALFDYDNFENKIKDKKNAELLKVKEGKIKFEGVSFQYPNKKERAVKEINLQINPNEKIALVGHSGCGKTTLVKLLYRLYDPDKGLIKIDGKDIKSFKQESLREALSIVPQEAILFDDTIYNNILFSKPNATKEEVIQAMKFAQLDRFIEKLPKKEKTIVGERGVKLSGGEKQRVSIARAILANKKILVLDEATSALDSKTEYEIQKDLNNLMKGRTSIIIAHRLSTIMHADKIIVLKEGKIVQMGRHNQLINEKGPYKELWKLQKGGYIKE